MSIEVVTLTITRYGFTINVGVGRDLVTESHQPTGDPDRPLAVRGFRLAGHRDIDSDTLDRLHELYGPAADIYLKITEGETP